MEIKAVELTREQALNLFPKLVCGMLEAPGATPFIAYEGSKICAYALMTQSEKAPDRCILQYLGKGKSGSEEQVIELLGYIENICRENGIRVLAGRFIDNVSKLKKVHEYMENNKYVVAASEGRLLMYYFQDLMDTAFVEKISDMNKLISHVKCFNELDVKQISKFAEAMKKDGEQFEMPDLVFGRFFVVNDEIVAYLDLCEVDEGVLLARKMHILKGNSNNQYALPAMMASAIMVSASLLSEETVIYMQITQNSIYQNIIRVFGEADSDRLITEYAKIL